MKLKKILAAAMAGVMVMASAVPAMAETASSLDNTAGWANPSNAGWEELTGDFDVTYSFTIDSVGANNWNNFVIEMKTEANDYLDIRADGFAFTNGPAFGVTFPEPGQPVTSVLQSTWTGKPEDDPAWAEWLKNCPGSTVEANLVRKGDEFAYTAKFSFGTTMTGKFSFGEVDVPNTVELTLFGDGASFSNITFTNNAAASEEPVESNTLECDAFWTTSSQAFELSDKELVLTCTTKNNGDANYHNLVYVIYNSEDSKVYPAGTEGYTEYGVGRADNFVWSGDISITESNAGEDFDWAAWLAATKEGAEVTITAKLVDGKAVVTLACAGLEYTSTASVDASEPVYLALTGEKCTLSDLTVNAEAAKFVSQDIKALEDPKDSDNNTDDTDDTDDTDNVDDSDNVEEEVYELDCPSWWSTFSDGFEITDELTTYKFTNTTYADAADVYCGPVYVLYTGSENKVNGEGYSELLVSRADGNAWFFDGVAALGNTVGNLTVDKTGVVGDATGDLPEGYTFTVTASPDWADYLAALKAGCEVTVTTQLVNGKAVITSSCAGMDYTVEVPVGDAEVLYLSFSGEATTLTNLTINDVPSSWGGRLDTTDGADDADGSDGTADGTPGNTNEPSSPKTADAAPVIPVAAALLGCAVVAFAAKKKLV